MNRRLLTGVAAVLVSATNAWGAVTHLYTFNDGTANDSVGGAHGTLVGGATISGGEAILGGGPINTPDTSANNMGPHVSFDAATIAINTYTAASIEVWLKSDTSNAIPTGQFTMAAALGRHTTNTGGNEAPWSGHQYIMMQPTRGGGPAAMRAAITNDRFENETGVNGVAQIADNLLHHWVVTINSTTISSYLDGVLQGSTALGSNSLSQLSNEVVYLGRSLYNDPFFKGSIDQFAIYNTALTQTEVTTNFNTGPVGTGSPGVATLTIDRDTGAMTLSKQGAPHEVFRYEINSASGALNPAQWRTIADNADSDSGSSFDDNDVWNVLTATNFTWSEEEPIDGGGDNGGLLGAGGTTSLPLSTAGGWLKSYREDVTMTLGILVNGIEATTPVNVVYTGNGGEPFMRSDFNFDNEIDEVDYQILLSNHLTTLTDPNAASTYLKGDVNGDLRNDVLDFRLFKEDFIAVNGLAAFNALVGAVPEPGSVALAVLAAAAVVGLRRRR